MRLSAKTLVALVVMSACNAAARADYGAIAYSQATGRYGYSWGKYSRAQAEAAALSQCPAADAKVVVWASDGYCALARGDKPGAYGWGWGSSQAIAEAHALAEARKRTSGAHIVICVFTGY